MTFSYSLIQSSELFNTGLVFLFENDAMFVSFANGKCSVPLLGDFKGGLETVLPLYSFGKMDGKVCYTGVFSSKSISISDSSSSFISLRKLYGDLSEGLFQASLCAIHTTRWNSNTQYCGQCGAAMELAESESAKVCSGCGYLHYPKISPAVIVAVVKENQILLGHSQRFPNKLYSVIAGFVEPGETLEQCVVREVKEETGIDVDSVKYFGSQPWPFPDSLMVGFTARYAGGTICVDGEEVVDAQWFTAEKLPNIPDGISISRKLIDWFLSITKK